MNRRLQICFVLALLLHAIFLLAVTIPVRHSFSEAASVPVDIVLVDVKPSEIPAPTPIAPFPITPEPATITSLEEPPRIEPPPPQPAPQPKPIEVVVSNEPVTVPREAEFRVAATAGRSVETPVDVPSADPITAPAATAQVVQATAHYRYNPAPEYPFSAKRRGQEGSVLLMVLLDTNGVPKNIKVKQSSGFSLLDNAAVNAVQGWRFEPARLNQQAVRSEVEVPIRFQLSK